MIPRRWKSKKVKTLREICCKVLISHWLGLCQRMSDDVKDFFSPSFRFPYFYEFNSFLFLKRRFSSCDSGKGEESSMVKEISSMVTSGLNDPRERDFILLSVLIENTALV